MTHGEHSKRAAQVAGDKLALHSSYAYEARQIVEKHLVNLFPPDTLEKIKQQGAEAIPQPIHRPGTVLPIGLKPRRESEVAFRAFQDSLETRGVDLDKISDLMVDLKALVDKMVGRGQGL